MLSPNITLIHNFCLAWQAENNEEERSQLAGAFHQMTSCSFAEFKDIAVANIWYDLSMDQIGKYEQYLDTNEEIAREVLGINYLKS